MTDTDTRTNRYLVPGLVRGLRVLELFDRTRPEWNLSELAAAAELPRSTTYRLVVTLNRLGYLENALAGKTYRLSARVLRLGFEYLGSQELVEIAQAPLERLGARTGGSTHLGVLDGTDSQLGRDRLLAEVVGPLCETAAGISRRLGWNGPTSVGTVGEEGSHVV